MSFHVHVKGGQIHEECTDSYEDMHAEKCGRCGKVRPVRPSLERSALVLSVIPISFVQGVDPSVGFRCRPCCHSREFILVHTWRLGA